MGNHAGENRVFLDEDQVAQLLMILMGGCALTSVIYMRIIAWIFTLELSTLADVGAALVGAVAGLVLSVLLAGR